tara:strand:+ start:684 stop:938 length:255 start_codon:yes stop_codon:yes gene_type:complete
MQIYIVYSNSVEFTESNEQYLNPCIQAIFTDEEQAERYADELSHSMNSGYYAAEEYPYIKSHDVRDKHVFQDITLPPNRKAEVA